MGRQILHISSGMRPAPIQFPIRHSSTKFHNFVKPEKKRNNLSPFFSWPPVRQVHINFGIIFLYNKLYTLSTRFSTFNFPCIYNGLMLFFHFFTGRLTPNCFLFSHRQIVYITTFYSSIHNFPGFPVSITQYGGPIPAWAAKESRSDTRPGSLPYISRLA